MAQTELVKPGEPVTFQRTISDYQNTPFNTESQVEMRLSEGNVKNTLLYEFLSTEPNDIAFTAEDGAVRNKARPKPYISLNSFKVINKQDSTRFCAVLLIDTVFRVRRASEG